MNCHNEFRNTGSCTKRNHQSWRNTKGSKPPNNKCTRTLTIKATFPGRIIFQVVAFTIHHRELKWPRQSWREINKIQVELTQLRTFIQGSLVNFLLLLRPTQGNCTTRATEVSRTITHIRTQENDWDHRTQREPKVKVFLRYAEVMTVMQATMPEWNGPLILVKGYQLVLLQLSNAETLSQEESF